MGKLFNTIKPLFLICFLLCTHFVLNAQKREPLTIKQLESTKEGSVILDYINTYNNGRKKTKTEVSRIFSKSLIDKAGVDKLNDMLFTEMEREKGFFELYEVTEPSKLKFELLLKGMKKSEWFTLTFMISDDLDKKIRDVTIGYANDNFKEKTLLIKSKKTSSLFSKKIKVNNSTLNELDTWLTKLENEKEFSGVVLIAKDYKPIFLKSFGKASYRFNINNNKNTKFNVGSLNKIFTAVGILQLAEQGRLKLDDKISKYLSEFKDPNVKKITIKHLLQHTSGWLAYWRNSTYLAKKNSLKTVNDYMSFIKEIPLEFEPGKKYSYSNTGYMVLGAIIETITKVDYFEYVKKNIFDISGMKNTDSYFTYEPISNLAIGYTKHYNEDNSGLIHDRQENILSKPLKGMPDGGGFSTVEDLLKFTKSVLNNTLLNKKFEMILRTDFGNFKNPKDYIFHNGGAPGVGAHMETNSETGYSVIVLSNFDMTEMFKVINKIHELTNLPLAQTY